MHEHELLPVVPILSSNNSDHWRHPLLRGRSIAQLLCASVHAIYTAPIYLAYVCAALAGTVQPLFVYCLTRGA